MQSSTFTRPKVAAFGEWNTTNLGDRAIFEGVKHFFQELGWDVDAYGLGSLTPVTGDSLPVINPEPVLAAAQTLSAPARPKRSILPEQSLKRSVRSFRQQLRIRRLLPQLRQAQAIAVGGGALLSDWNLHFPQSLAAVAWAANRLQLPIFCLGCSAEGEWSEPGKQIIANFLKSCRVVATRDAGTASRVAELLSAPVEVFGDFALVLQPEARPTAEPQILAVNVMELPGIFEEAQAHYEDQLVAALNLGLEQGKIGPTTSIRVFTTGNPEDALPAQRVFNRLNTSQKQLYLPRSLEDLHQSLRSSQIVIASRLHAAILAISENATVIGFTPGSKIKRFFASIGIADFSIDTHSEQAIANLLHSLALAQATQQRPLIDLSAIEASRSKVKFLFSDLTQECISVS